MDNQISLYRDQLYYELSNYKGNEKSIIRLRKEVIDKILFNVDDDSRKTFAFPDKLMKNLDFTDVSFDNFDFRGFDAEGFYGITINTDSIYKNDLSYSILNGVCIIGSIDGIKIDGTDFRGSIFINNKVKSKKS
jgi:uncharacterized protein YjbI with pentapeptide repeats